MTTNKNSELFAPGDFPALDSPLIQSPGHIFNPFAGQSRSLEHRFALAQTEERWLWAHVLRGMGGWRVISAGRLSRSLFKTADEASEYLAIQFLGVDRDGIDRLSHEAFSQKARIAHIRRKDEPQVAYCGQTGGGRAVFDTSEPNYAEQHCIKCDQGYRASHYGRTPITY